MHNKKPEKVKNIPEDVLENVNRLIGCNYHNYIEKLNKLIIGKDVINSKAGNSGYSLLLENKKWLICYFESGKLLWKICDELLPENERLLFCKSIKNTNINLENELPYANEENNISKEVKNSHGKKSKELL
jgi:hypothetical protein